MTDNRKDMMPTYRAYKALAGALADDASNADLQKAFASASQEEDTLSFVRKKCVISGDWVEAIQNGLPYISSAIAEERRYLSRDGEVVRLDRVKRVSKETVVHLARHSELVTHVPAEGERLMPDKLYMTENNENYCIYENRFLYMLLCFLRDFTAIRHDAIVAADGYVRHYAKIKKEVHIKKRSLTYYTELLDEGFDGDKSRSKAPSLLQSIEEIQGTIDLLLSTFLMKQVESSPLLKPPITRTNILKCDNNFREAFELYSFIANYASDGYEIKTIENSMSPLDVDAMSDFTYLSSMQFFVSRMNGEGIRNELQSLFNEQELKLKRSEYEYLFNEIDAACRALCQNGYTPECASRIEECVSKLKGVYAETARIADEAKAFAAESEAEAAEALRSLAEAQEAALKEAEKHRFELRSIIDSNAEAAEAAVKRHREETEALIADREKAVSECEARKQAEMQALEDAWRERLKNETDAFSAQLRGARVLAGIADPGDEFFTTEDGFKQLERERKAFEALYSAKWRKTKKRIRKDLLWRKRR